MLGLFDTRDGLRHERKTDIIEWERQMERYRQRTRVARAQSFYRVFAAVGHGIETALVGLAASVRRYRRWRVRQATIRELSALDDRMLRDIGLARSSIPALAAKLVDDRRGTPTPGQSDAGRRHEKIRGCPQTADEHTKTGARQRAA